MSDQKPDPKHDESFRVVDRRLFTPEGELRPEAQEEKRREQAEASQAQRAAKSEKAASASAASKSAPAPPPQPEPEGERYFQMLVEMLARNAAALMGGVPDPATGQSYMDLEAAREMIDMLDTLRDKTRGHLTAEEEALLGDALGSLKLSFMQISKAAAKAMREGAKGGR